MKSGIYKITNEVNNKCYIGSSVDVNTRILRHYDNLMTRKHENIVIQAAWDKYGPEVFTFERVLMCDINVLLQKEQEMIDYHQCVAPKGYNICPIAGNCLGTKHSAESRDKMKGNKNGRGNKGRVNSPETRARLSISHIGRPNNQKGLLRSDETKLKMRLAKLGKPSKLKGTTSPLKGRISPLKGRPSPLRGRRFPLRHNTGTKKGYISPLRGRPSPIKGTKRPKRENKNEEITQETRTLSS